MAAHLRPFARIVRVSLVLFLLGPTFGVSSSTNLSAETQVETNGVARLGFAKGNANADLILTPNSALVHENRFRIDCLEPGQGPAVCSVQGITLRHSQMGHAIEHPATNA